MLSVVLWGFFVLPFVSYDLVDITESEVTVLLYVDRKVSDSSQW